MTWRPDGPAGNETGKIRHRTPPYTRGKGLDIGAGAHRLWPHCITLDNFDELPGEIDPNTGQPWHPDVIADAEDLSIFADESLDFVYSSHLLEHLDDTEAVLREWWRVIKVSEETGFLVLYLPHADLYPNMGEKGANPHHLHDFRPGDIEEIMQRIGSWDLVENETRAGGDEYSFLQVYRKRAEGQSRSYLDRQSITQKRLLVTRYGGIGDQLIASSVLPALKAQGYHITFNTVPQGRSVLQQNPYIDEFLMQDKDQVPSNMLGEYWEAIAKEYDEAINLSESLEGPLLKMPGRRDRALTHEARRMLCGEINYLEFVHAAAGFSGEPESIFYSTDEEKAEAHDFRRRHKDSPVLLWALGGSAVHKVYPWVDVVTVWLLEHTDCKILFSGGEPEQHLEFQVVQQVAKHFLGMSQEDTEKKKLSDLLLALKEHFGQNRLLCTCGGWSLRQKLTFAAEAADMLVGPETGIMWAAAMKETPKVLFLSHSNRLNVTKYWTDVSALEPERTPCYPCHILHHGWENCVESPDQPGSALCCANISAKRAFDSILYWLRERGYEKAIHMKQDPPDDDGLRYADRRPGDGRVDQELG